MTGPVPYLDRPASGNHDFHPDCSLNFQCNRWLEWIGPEARDEIASAVCDVRSYDEWIDAFLALPVRARAAGREIAAAYYDRAAEFFIPPQDWRKAAGPGTLPRRHPRTVQNPAGPGSLPGFLAAHLRPAPRRTVEPAHSCLVRRIRLLHRGIPAFAHRRGGGRVSRGGIRGSGKGSALARRRRHRVHPRVGASGGGGARPLRPRRRHRGRHLAGRRPVIRATAFEPRIRRAVAWDILDDELDGIARHLAPAAAPVLRALLALRARPIVNAVARLRQLHRQARNLTDDCSITARVFTAAEQAGNHRQVGNTMACVRWFLAWADMFSPASK